MKNYLDYFKEVDQTPWGKLFYKLLWHQLDPYIKDHDEKILDFGSGFGKTSNHFASMADVTAYEPNEEMLKISYRSHVYKQISGNIEEFSNQVKNDKFDLIMIHNVLEYVPDIAKTISTLSSLLKTDGKISIVKHNLLGHVFARAVLNDDPRNALLAYQGSKITSKNFGHIHVYPNQQLEVMLKSNDMSIDSIRGIRTVFGLSNNQKIKEEASWQDAMFELESELENDAVAKQTAFFQHIMAVKNN